MLRPALRPRQRSAPLSTRRRRRLRRAGRERNFSHVISHLRTRLERAAPSLLVGVLPTCLLVVGIVHFMLNHFFVRPPYLLDTGMLSWLAYRDGVLLEAPKIALDYVKYYYDVYFSPMT